jgi:hypothetical protein
MCRRGPCVPSTLCPLLNLKTGRMPGGTVIRVAKIEIRKFRAKSSGRLNAGVDLFGFTPVSFCIRSAAKLCPPPDSRAFGACLRESVSLAGLTRVCAREGRFENAWFEFEKNLNGMVQKNQWDTPRYSGGIP